MSRTRTISSWSASNVTTRCRAGSSPRPAQISAYISATRAGVRTRPSRSGSSPIATRISRTAFSIRPRSMPAPATSGHSSVSVMPRLSVGRTSSLRGTPLLGGSVAGVLGDVRQVAIALGDVEAVADHEPVGNREPDVLQIGIAALQTFLHQQGAHVQRRRVARNEVLAQVREREAGVDDVLDDEHVAVGEVEVEVL